MTRVTSHIAESASEGARPIHPAVVADSGLLDEAYEQLAHAAAELPNGFVNHGPMACEALCVLGYEDRIPELARRYASATVQVEASADPLDVGRWWAALGHIELLHAWTAFFARSLADEGWRSVVRRWVPRLSPAMDSVLFHGMIRTAHAVRAVQATATEPRTAELARALGYWAARYDTGRTAAQVGPSAVVGDVSMDAMSLVLREAELAARRYIARPTVVLLHGVTGAMALALLLGHLDETDADRTVRQLARVARALAPDAPPPAPPGSTATFEGLAALAVESGDVHQIKLVEACRRADRETHIDTFATAAASATAWSR